MKLTLCVFVGLLVGLWCAHAAHKQVVYEEQRCRAVNGVYVQGTSGVVCIEARVLPLKAYL